MMTSDALETVLGPHVMHIASQETEARATDRRWLTSTGLYVALIELPAEERRIESSAVDYLLSTTVDRYTREFDGRVSAVFEYELTGAIAARLARLNVVSGVGESLGLLVLAAQSARHLVTLQLAWPVERTRMMESEVVEVMSRFRLS